MRLEGESRRDRGHLVGWGGRGVVLHSAAPKSYYGL